MQLLVATVLAAVSAPLRPVAARFRHDVERFQDEPVQDIDGIVARVQKVLCDNFPTIPCQLIAEDETLHRLIRKSISQIRRRDPALDPTPVPDPAPAPGPASSSPPVEGEDLRPVDSEDLSKFLEVKHTGYFDPPPKKNKKKWAKDMHKKKSRAMHRGRSIIRTYYPHKIKYKVPKTFVKESEENPSNSGEFHRQERKRLSFEPMWKMDYTKHGVPPSMPLSYRRQEFARGKMGGINDDEFTKHEAREVLRSKMYINSSRKNQIIRNDSRDQK